MAIVYRIIIGVSYLLKALLVVTAAVLTLPLVFYTHPHSLVYLITDSHLYVNNSVEPKACNLTGRNFYLDSSQGLLPVWHLYPRKFNSTEEAVEDLRRKETPMLLYLHGKNKPRTMLKAYQDFLDDGFHLIVPELRGFLDSSGPFSGQAAVEELLHVHIWLTAQYVPGKRIVWWCFSLGTGICMQAAPELKSHRPDGIILEAPYSSMREMLMSNMIFRGLAGWFPILSNAVLSKVEKKYDMKFVTKENILKLPDVPILHVHARDDPTIKYDKHFKKIHDAVRGQTTRRAAYYPVTLRACRGVGHYPISRNISNDIRQLIHNFWEEIVWPGSHSGNQSLNGSPLTTNVTSTMDTLVLDTTTRSSTVTISTAKTSMTRTTEKPSKKTAKETTKKQAGQTSSHTAKKN